LFSLSSTVISEALYSSTLFAFSLKDFEVF